MSSTALQTLTSTLAERLSMGADVSGLMTTLKATAFKGNVSDEQMTALMIVANQYALNPWTKEIYAFQDRNNGIVPVVGVDGWSRIINTHPQFDGIEFEQDEDSCTCIIYRKDRSHPIKVTEYMSECKRSGVGPWASHPKRMLRHKAMIQCARIAFGYGGIYDQDEAERIIEATPPARHIDAATGEIKTIEPLDVAQLKAAIDQCQTVEELKTTWQTISAKAQVYAKQTKDKAAYEELKAHTTAKKTAIENADIIDMPADDTSEGLQA